MDHPAEEIALESAVLRRWRSTDLAALHRVVTEALPHLRPWMPWAAGDYSLEDAVGFLQKTQDNWHTGRAFTYAITVGETIAGCISLERRIAPTGLEIGYWLHPGHTGRGLVTTAAAALVDRALALPGVDHVEIWHDAGNTASGAVPQRLGFTCVDRRSPPRELPTSPGEAGIDVIWRLTR